MITIDWHGELKQMGKCWGLILGAQAQLFKDTIRGSRLENRAHENAPGVYFILV